MFEPSQRPSGAPSRKSWFRPAHFPLAILVALGAFIAWSYLTNGPLQGTWRGTGPDAQCSLTFAGDSLVTRGGEASDPITPPVQAWFKIDAPLGYMEIQRDGNVQLGRFALDGDTLVLKLATPGQPWPTDLAANPQVASERRYVFKRVR